MHHQCPNASGSTSRQSCHEEAFPEWYRGLSTREGRANRHLLPLACVITSTSPAVIPYSLSKAQKFTLSFPDILLFKKNKTGITKGSNYNKTLHICSDSNSPCQQSPLSLCVMKFIRSKRNTKSHLGSQQPCHYVRGWSQEWVWWTLVNPESIMERGHIATHSNPEYSCLKQQHRQPDFTEAQTKWGPLSWDGRGIQK